MCGQCRKAFKDRKDIRQHLSSDAHNAIQYSCTSCGKGFGSIGALTLHMEQAGHKSQARVLDTPEVTSAQMSLKTLGDHTQPNEHNFAGQGRFGGLPTRPAPLNGYPFKRDSVEESRHQMNRNLSTRLFIIHIAGHSSKTTLNGGAAYLIADAINNTTLLQKAFHVKQLHACSMEPEYEALREALQQCVERGITSIVVRTSSELLYLHFTDQLPIFFRTNYHAVDTAMKKITRIIKTLSFFRIELIAPTYSVFLQGLAAEAALYPDELYLPYPSTPGKQSGSNKVTPRDGSSGKTAASSYISSGHGSGSGGGGGAGGVGGYMGSHGSKAYSPTGMAYQPGIYR